MDGWHLKSPFGAAVVNEIKEINQASDYERALYQVTTPSLDTITHTMKKYAMEIKSQETCGNII